MTSVRQGALALGIGFWLAAQAWAGPRVALIIPVSGEVKLGGAKLSEAKLADEGQLVSLGQGAEVRIQLLGSSKEKTLRGKVDYTISKAILEKEGKAASRGSVVVASEIGNLTRAGAGTSRPATFQPVGLAFQWPPALENGRWVSRAVTPLGRIKASQKDPVFVTIIDLSEAGRAVADDTITEPVDSMTFDSKTFVPGHQYRLDVQRNGTQSYFRHFRILTEEEKETLASTERILRETHGTAIELPTLIRLASLYKSFDQNEKMVAVLTEAVHHPAYGELDSVVVKQLDEALNVARHSLDEPDYHP